MTALFTTTLTVKKTIGPTFYMQFGKLFIDECKKVHEDYRAGLQAWLKIPVRKSLFAVYYPYNVWDPTCEFSCEIDITNSLYRLFVEYGTGLFMKPGWTPAMTESVLAAYQQPPGNLSRGIPRPDKFIYGRGSPWLDPWHGKPMQKWPGATFMKWPGTGQEESPNKHIPVPGRRIFYKNGYWYSNMIRGQKPSRGGGGQPATRSVTVFSQKFLNRNLLDKILRNMVSKVKYSNLSYTKYTYTPYTPSYLPPTPNIINVVP